MARNCRQCEALLRVVEMQAQAIAAHQRVAATFDFTAKQVGSTVNPAHPTAVDSIPAVIVKAIDARSGRDPHMKFYLGGVAAELLVAGFDETEVAQRILDGDQD